MNNKCYPGELFNAFTRTKNLFDVILTISNRDTGPASSLSRRDLVDICCCIDTTRNVNKYILPIPMTTYFDTYRCFNAVLGNWYVSLLMSGLLDRSYCYKIHDVAPVVHVTRMYCLELKRTVPGGSKNQREKGGDSTFHVLRSARTRNFLQLLLYACARCMMHTVL